MEIKHRFIPPYSKRTRPGIKMIPKYITIHSTDNICRGANAYAHAQLQASGNSRQASWHYTCDSNEIWQSIPDNEIAWHAGDNRGPGNMSSIGVEICVNADGNFTKAKENAIWLVRKLMVKYNIPITRVVPHKHWTGKTCPKHLLKDWAGFIREIQGQGSNKKLPQMIRVEVDGKPVVDSQVPTIILKAVQNNLGKEIVIKMRG